MKAHKRLVWFAIFILALIGCKREHPFIRKASFQDGKSIAVEFAGPTDESWAKNAGNYLACEERDPDIRLAISEVSVSRDGRTAVLHFEEELDRQRPHVLTIRDMTSLGKPQGTTVLTVKKVYWENLFAIFIGAMLIQNFVFTRYLGLCVFFGTSRRKSTAIGMGITFTIVIVCASMMSYLFYQFILKPFDLYFLEIVVFIGLVALSVQAVDTILRKVNPVLFKAFGVYLVLVIANCVIIAVPLILADNEYDPLQSLMLASGAGLGFLLALFLMSSVREKLELANVPKSFQGLPIAFILAGLFALAFSGFSGMSLF